MAYKVLYDFYSFLLLKVLFIQLEKTNKTMDDQIPFPKENTDYKSHDIFPALFFFQIYLTNENLSSSSKARASIIF